MTVTATGPVEQTDPSAGEPGGVAVPRLSAWWVLIAGVIGLTAAMTLTIEKIEILINPDYVPTCSINPVLSCGSVMITPQASVFGFLVTLMGCYHGYKSRGGAQGVGAATTNAVVSASILILIFDYMLTEIFFTK